MSPKQVIEQIVDAIEQPVEQAAEPATERAVEEPRHGAQQVAEQVAGARHRVDVEVDLRQVDHQAQQVQVDRTEVKQQDVAARALLLENARDVGELLDGAGRAVGQCAV